MSDQIQMVIKSTFPLPDDHTPVVLEENIRSIREALGVANSNSTSSDIKDASNDNDDGNAWGNHLDALGDKLNSEGDRTGFLRMVSRNSRLNGSSYSLSSLFSVGGSVVTAAARREVSPSLILNNLIGYLIVL